MNAKILSAVLIWAWPVGARAAEIVFLEPTAEAISKFLDLSHGATMSPRAEALWADLYQASLRFDVRRMQEIPAALEKDRAESEKDALSDPAALGRNLGPVIVVEVPDSLVQMEFFGGREPLRFDLNAATRGQLRLIRGLDASAVDRILAERNQGFFKSLEDFSARCRVDPTDVGMRPAK